MVFSGHVFKAGRYGCCCCWFQVPLTVSLVKGVPAKNSSALPDWLHLATALNICKTLCHFDLFKVDGQK